MLLEKEKKTPQFSFQDLHDINMTLFTFLIHIPGFPVHDSAVRVIQKTNTCVFAIFHQHVKACPAFLKLFPYELTSPNPCVFHTELLLFTTQWIPDQPIHTLRSHLVNSDDKCVRKVCECHFRFPSERPDWLLCVPWVIMNEFKAGNPSETERSPGNSYHTEERSAFCGCNESHSHTHTHLPAQPIPWDPHVIDSSSRLLPFHRARDTMKEL